MKKLLKLLTITALLGLIAGAGVGAAIHFDLIEAPAGLATLVGDAEEEAAPAVDASSAASDTKGTDKADAE